MNDLDELRRKRIQALQQQAMANENQQSQEIQQQQLQQDMEAKKRQLMIQALTPEARERLDNLRLTKPEFVEQIEIQLIQLAQSGRMKGKVTDYQLKVLLQQVTGQKRKINISRR